MKENQVRKIEITSPKEAIRVRKHCFRVKKDCFRVIKDCFCVKKDCFRVKKGCFSREKQPFFTRFHLILDAIKAGVSVNLQILVVDGLKKDKVLYPFATIHVFPANNSILLPVIFLPANR